MSALFLELARAVLFFLLLPSHIQIEDDLLNGGSCPTWRNGKSSFCGEACHTQASCVCWCCWWGKFSYHNPCRQTTMDHQNVFRHAGLSWQALDKPSSLVVFFLQVKYKTKLFISNIIEPRRIWQNGKYIFSVFLVKCLFT